MHLLLRELNQVHQTTFRCHLTTSRMLSSALTPQLSLLKRDSHLASTIGIALLSLTKEEVQATLEIEEVEIEIEETPETPEIKEIPET